MRHLIRKRDLKPTNDSLLFPPLDLHTQSVQDMIGFDVETGNAPFDPLGTKLGALHFLDGVIFGDLDVLLRALPPLFFLQLHPTQHAGFSKDENSLYKYRAVELKHGRVAMLACLGTLVQSYTHLPGTFFSCSPPFPPPPPPKETRSRIRPSKRPPCSWRGWRPRPSLLPFSKN